MIQSRFQSNCDNFVTAEELRSGSNRAMAHPLNTSHLFRTEIDLSEVRPVATSAFGTDCALPSYLERLGFKARGVPPVSQMTRLPADRIQNVAGH